MKRKSLWDLMMKVGRDVNPVWMVLFQSETVGEGD